ncbi:MAG: DUF3987 domain-containing protein [Pirellulales bacterium]|nr:DUF3987 domain-containing protein [Pirellulales bacterium]
MSASGNGDKAPDTAREYVRRGWHVIPIPPKAKTPKIDAWEQLRIGEAELTKHFRTGSNIGVLNGEPSGWLVDIDLDHALARELADEFLPPTGAEFGRASSPRSHRLYVVTGPVETRQRRLPKQNGKAPMIVELRSTGSQTVFPGSVHPSGEPIEWNSDGEPASVAPGLLVAAQNALADAVEARLGIVRTMPSQNGHTSGLRTDTADRARKYLAKLPPAISGQGGHDQTFRAACVLVLGFELQRGPALELLREWNQSCEPPWSERELQHKIDDALEQPGERGYLLYRPKTATPLPAQSKQIHRPVEIVPYQIFPVEVLPGIVGTFVAEAAAAIGCDASFVALPTLACLARAIGNKRVIRLKRTWQEPAIVWAAIVGKSGTHKSPSIAEATKCLQAKQAEAMVQYQEAQRHHEQERALYERDYAAWKRNKTTEPPPWEPQEPALARYIVSDITIEALADRLHRQFDGVLVVRDELAGWLGGIAEYKGGQGSDLGHWLASWSAAPLTVDRKTGAIKTVHIPRAAVNIVGGIQPGVLRSAIGREHLQDGLCARLLLAMPQAKPVRWTEATVSPATEATIGKVYERLLALEPAADEEGNAAPFAMPLTPEAKAVWVSYYNRHRAELAELDDDLAAAWSKLEAYAARFALIFQLVAWAQGEAGGDAVDESSMAAAIKLADWFGGEARRMYGVLRETEQDREHRELIELIRRKRGRITARKLAHASSGYRGAGEAEASLERLVKAGLGCWETSATGGRPAQEFVLSEASNSNGSPETVD